MKRLLCLTLVLLLHYPRGAAAQSTAQEALQQAATLFEGGDVKGSAGLLEKAIDAAVAERNPEVEAEARRRLGNYLATNAQYEPAEQHLRTAIALFEQLGNPAKAASAKTSLGLNAYYRGNQEDAARYYGEAMAVYTSLNDRAAVAQLRYSMTFFSQTPAEKLEHIRTGLELAREIGARSVEALLLHSWADMSYTTDGFDAAFDRLNQARSIFEGLGNRSPELSRILTSLGRLYRVHGRPDQAIPFYEQARQLQIKTGDKPGVIQSLESIAVALNILGRHADAVVRLQEALALAQETESPLLIAFVYTGLASTHLQLKQYKQAADLLEQAKTMPRRNQSVFQLLAEARLGLGQYEAALNAANEGLEVDRTEERVRSLRSAKARALQKLGRSSEALAEIRLVTESLEKARRTLIPTDFMKQGFSNTDRGLTTISIDVLLDSNQPRQALAAAELARGRAFLDLLATKSLPPEPVPVAPTPALVTLGVVRDLPSQGSAASASDDDLVMLAKRLDATILAYWVSPDSTTIWTVSPVGEVMAARTDGDSTLSAWIDQATHASPPAPVTVALRSGDALLTGRGNPAAWKRLYNGLIRPVRGNLPKGTRRLLIIPSGPLFRLSFAALMDEKGRYLIEDYSLLYAPNAAALMHTLQTKRDVQNRGGRYVFVSNPSGMPADNGKTLPPLPGADDEVKKIQRLIASEAVSTLRGAAADETSVREAMGSARLIHFATHGIVSTDDPFASYLALGREENGSADGRLSAEEIYGLNLHADLVVLSACRSGLGRISGDGVAGLARAFFYAGTASVVATLWDVADGPASQLVADFYQSLGPNLQNNKSEALRTAQLRLLRALRRGEVRVDTPFGKLPLPEDPVLWAGFVLIGEP